ncbi:hypothetical protein GGP50_003250 [Salinibacter ruber]|uniref:hypothetical protein n=1 Tax=Salinibacter ruber TaxID=146919 RepID=UPI00216A95C8|nr:hypothetical protein [Salinibacter ruber]MCS4195013.1 hypothetical protein [Salinibacter ruber]
MESEAQPSKPDTRSAELPDDLDKPDLPPDTTKSGKPSGRKDRGAVPPDGREEKVSKSGLERCEKTIKEHLRSEIEFSRAAREIINDRLYTEKDFEDLGEYTKATFGVGQNAFRKWTYYAKVFDIIEGNRDEIAEECSLTDVRDVPLPRVKAWTRPLHAKANKGFVDQVIETWAAVVRRHGSSITGEKVKEVHEELFEEENDSEEDSENDGDSEDEHPEEEETGHPGCEDGSSDRSGDAGEGDTDNGQTGEEDSADNDTSGDASPENSSSNGTGGIGDGDTGSFSVDVPDETQGVALSSPPTQAEVADLAQEVEQGEEGFHDSSAEDMVASKVWKVLVPSPIGFGAGLPEEVSPDEDPVGAVLKTGRLDQITGLAPGDDGERVLVCPGVDLFAEVVPDGAIEAVLSRCRKTDHQPVVFTRHLSRASDFDLSDLWVGTAADHSCVDDKPQALSDAAPDAAVQWLLYDVDKEEDPESPPSFSGETDWVVYDPPGRAGISLTVAETQSLVEAAEESGVDWSFRETFKTCGDSGPSEEDEVCSVGHSDEDSGSEDGPDDENEAV